MKDTHNLNEMNISKVGALLADPARTAIIVALCKEVPLPAGELAERAGISASTTSIHLARLVEAAWVEVEQHGRQHYYRLASPQVKTLLEQAMLVAPTSPLNPLTPLSSSPFETERGHYSRHDGLRLVRTCYDHLAGKLGVALTDALIKQDVLEVTNKDFKLTDDGKRKLQNMGVDVANATRQRRAFARRCLDWTERRDHLGGALGAAICNTWVEQGLVQRQEGSRVLLVTPAGEAQLETWEIKKEY
jgi:DNA-binding transcriptional ArsR family regulator